MITNVTKQCQTSNNTLINNFLCKRTHLISKGFTQKNQDLLKILGLLKINTL